MGNELRLVLTLNSSQFDQAVKTTNDRLQGFERQTTLSSGKASKSITDLEKTVVTASSSMRDSLSGLKSALGGLALAEVGKSAIQVAMDFQAARVGIKALVGDAEVGQKLFDDIQQFALSSPFQFKDLLIGSQRLLAFNFEAKNVVKTLESLSSTVGALGGDSGKFADLITAVGQIRTASKLTGEELRQLRNVGVENIARESLAKAYKISLAEVDAAQRKGIIRGPEASGVIIDGLRKKFEKFNEEVAKTAKTSWSNFIDALQILADQAIGPYLPKLSSALNDLRYSLADLNKWFKESADDIRAFGKAVLYLGELFVASKIAYGLSNMALAIGAMSANPVALFATAMGLAAVATFNQAEALRDLNKADMERAAVQQYISGKKTLKELKEMGYDEARLKGIISSRSLDGKSYFSDVGKELGIHLVEGQQDEALKLAEDTKKAKKKIDKAEKRSVEILDTARKKEVTGVARVIEEFRQYNREVGISVVANRNLAEAIRLRLATETEKEMRKASSDQLDRERDLAAVSLSVDTRKFSKRLEYDASANQAAIENLQERLSQESVLYQAARDKRLRDIELIDTTTVAGKIEVERRKASIEEEYARKSLELKKDLLRIEGDIEVIKAGDNAALKLAIQEKYELALRRMRLEGDAEQQKIREDAVIQEAQIIRQSNQDAFESVRRSAEGLLDQLLTRSKSWGNKMKAILEAALLTPVKDFASRLIASLLTGQDISSGSRRSGIGGIMATGSGGGWSGALAGFGGMFSGGGGTFGSGWGGSGNPYVFSAAGGGSRSAMSAQDLYMAINGQGSLGGGSYGSRFGGFNSMGGNYLANLKSFLGMSGSISTGAGSATTWAAASNMQRLSALGKSSAAMVAGAALAIDGLRRGGVRGVAETTAGGAMIGYKFGGGTGAAIGAAVGFFAGMIRLFIKGALEKLRDKIKAVHGVDISEKNVLQQILEIIKQNYGGNLDMGVRSQSVKELVELYALSTGKPFGGKASMQAYTYSQSGGAYASQPVGGAYSASNYSASLDSLRSTGQTSGVGGSTVLNFQIDGQTVASATLQNGRVVAAANVKAMRSNAGRRELTALQISPGLITA